MQVDWSAASPFKGNPSAELDDAWSQLLEGTFEMAKVPAHTQGG